ncbi:MAG: iron donor protein CyaY [Proteobacteria bacterium]|nr:iron donor protein CyaY [Pseudomonadota bacterium]
MDTFHQDSQHALEKVADFFETSWPQADVDLLEEALTVTLSSGQQYLLNKHGVTRQIWLSSPFTGAHHFYHKGEEWVCTRTNVSLSELLLNELDTYAT